MPTTVNLIPMAGAGQRFAQAGYVIPKPLIPVGGVPMVVRAAGCLPAADSWVFACRDEHLAQYPLQDQLLQHFPAAQTIPICGLTQGQANTCLLALNHIDPDVELTIGACDNGMAYETEGLNGLLADGAVDAVIWTFRDNPIVLRDPSMYGWVEIGNNGEVGRVSCKIPLSPDPVRDHAIIGTFTFRSARIFIDCAEKLVAMKRTTNGEYYIDEVMNVAIEEGLNVRVFEVDHYIGWGTPADLQTYNYWREYFQRTGF